MGYHIDFDADAKKITINATNFVIASDIEAEEFIVAIEGLLDHVMRPSKLQRTLDWLRVASPQDRAYVAAALQEEFAKENPW